MDSLSSHQSHRYS